MNKKLILSVLVALTIISCSKDYYRNLTNEEKSLLPYEVGQIVKFKNSENDTIICTIDSSAMKYEKEHLRMSVKVDNLYLQYLKFIFISGDSLFMKLSIQPTESYTNFANLGLYCAIDTMSYWEANPNEYYLYPAYYLQSKEDTLVISNHTYSGVYLFSKSSTSLFEKIYLKPNKGVLKILFSNDFLELIE